MFIARVRLAAGTVQFSGMPLSWAILPRVTSFPMLGQDGRTAAVTTVGAMASPVVTAVAKTFPFGMAAAVKFG